MKRFTETAKWDDPWFRRLRPEIKLLWQWLLDRCDAAGIIDVDLDLASFHIGYPYPLDTLSEFGERVTKLPCGKLFITKFIAFQYGELSEGCKPHRPIFQSLEKHGLKGYPKGTHTLQEKEKEQDKDKDKDKTAQPPPKKTEQIVAVPIVIPEFPEEETGPDLTTQTRDLMQSLMDRINESCPSWKKRPNFTRAEMETLHANARVMADIIDGDWDMLRVYMASEIPAEWGKFWQPDGRRKFIETITDVLSNADRWRVKCKREGITTGLEPATKKTNP